MKVLIAEDDTASRIVLEKYLAEWGYEVFAAQDGDQAWQIFQQKQPQILLADWIMPRVDGLELCKRIRQLPADRYTYIIFLTSKTETQDIVTALDAGADDYLCKPFDKNILRSRMAVGARTVNYDEQMRLAKENAQRAQTKLERLNLRLEDTYKKLIEAAHKAGMAEVAADVLHNVGNALNSINIAVSVIAESVTNLEVQNLIKLAEMLNKHSDNLADFLSNDPQAKHIPAYLNELGKHLLSQQANMIEKLHILARSVEQVKDIIKAQQRYAGIDRNLERVSLNELIENAIEISLVGLRNQNIEVIREYADIGNIIVDKQRVLQILVNLIANAEHALSKSSREPKLLRIKTLQTNNRVRIEVSDNGIGIDPANIEMIFEKGYTTSEDGHGYGLFSSRQAAKDMNATLTAYSQGLNKGATFILELPLEKVEVKNGINS